MKQRTIRKVNSLSGAWNFLCGLVALVAFFGLAVVRDSLASTLAKFGQPIINHLVPSAPLLPAWAWITCLLGVILLVLILTVRLGASLLSRPHSHYFEEIDFRERSSATITAAVEGMLSHEKAKPYFVHTAPEALEIGIVCALISKKGFAFIRGGPGEGKSMIGYHAAYKLFSEKGYRCYRLKVEIVEARDDKSITEDLLRELDSLKGEKLIVVDDAQNLVVKNALNFPREAKEGNGRYVIIETEYDLEKSSIDKQDKEGVVRVNLAGFVPRLREYFLESDDFTRALEEFGGEAGFQGELEGAIELVTKGKIRDIWHFVFVTTRGEARLTDEIEKLTNIQMLLLFLISSDALLSGESELSRDYLLDRLLALKGTIGWLEEELRSTTYDNTLTALQKQTETRKSLIRIYDGTHIGCLHYRFARAVIRAGTKVPTFPDLLRATRILLTTDYRKSAYIAIFLRDIDSDANSFIHDNREWFLNYLNRPLHDQLSAYPNLLGAMKAAGTDCNQVIRELNVPKIAKMVSHAQPRHFQQIGRLVDALEPRADEFLKNLDIDQLATTAKTTQPAQFGQLTQLLKCFESIGEELVNQLDFRNLSQAAANTTIEQLPQLATLIKATGTRRDRFIAELTQSGALKKIAETVSNASYAKYRDVALLLGELGDCKTSLVDALNFRKLIEDAKELTTDGLFGLTYFVASLDEKDRNRLIREIDWAALCHYCPIDSDSLGVWGRCAKNSVQKAELSGDDSNVRSIRTYLQNNKDTIADVISTGIEREPTKSFGGLARFLASCSLINPSIGTEIANRILPARSSNFRMTSYNFPHVGQFLRSLYGLDPESAKIFINQEGVHRKIFGFFRHGKFLTNRDLTNVKFLIRVLYRIDRALWQNFVRDREIAYALRRVDLPSLYEEVDNPTVVAEMP